MNEVFSLAYLHLITAVRWSNFLAGIPVFKPIIYYTLYLILSNDRPIYNELHMNGFIDTTNDW